MPDQAALAIAPRFTRAVHIRRDFRDLRYRLDGYQVTEAKQVRRVKHSIESGVR